MATDEDSEDDFEAVPAPSLVSENILPVIQAAGDVVMSLDGTWGRTVDAVIDDLANTEYHDAGYQRVGVDAHALARLMTALKEAGVLFD